MSIDKSLDFINLPNKITNLQHIEFNLGQAFEIKFPVSTAIPILTKPKPNSKLEQARKQWRERDLERELKIKKLYKEIDNDNNLFDYEKQTIKGLVVATDGYYKLETVKKFVDTIDQCHKKELTDLWQRSNDQISPWEEDYWKPPNERSWEPRISARKWINEIDGEHKAHIHGGQVKDAQKIAYPKDKQWIQKRNVHIEDIREKYIVKSKKSRARYGGYPWVYISEEDRQRFLKEVEDLGPVRQTPKIESKKDALKYTLDVLDDDNTRLVEITQKEYDLEYDSNRYQEDEL